MTSKLSSISILSSAFYLCGRDVTGVDLVSNQPGQSLADNVEKLLSAQGAEVVGQATRSRNGRSAGSRARDLGLGLGGRGSGSLGGRGRRSSGRSGSSRSRSSAGRRARVGGRRSARVQSRARDFVGVELLVNVDEDTRVVLAVELSTKSTRGRCAAATSNLEVDTLRVALGTVLVSSGVQGNNFMTQDVVTGSNVAGNSDGVAVVVGNQIVASPCARDVAVVDETLLVDLEELERGLVDLGAVTVAVGQVGDDRTMVTLRPFSPLKLNILTSCHRSRDGTGLRTLVTDNIRVREGAGRDKAQVSSFGRPSNGFWGAVGVSVGGNDVSSVVLAIHNGTGDITVTSDHSGRAEKKTSDLGDRHFCEWIWFR